MNIYQGLESIHKQKLLDDFYIDVCLKRSFEHQNIDENNGDV